MNTSDLYDLFCGIIGKVATSTSKLVAEEKIAAAQAAVKAAEQELDQQSKTADELKLSKVQKDGMLARYQTTLDAANKELDVAEQALVHMASEEQVRDSIRQIKDALDRAVQASGLSKAKGERGEYNRVAPSDKAVWIKPGTYFYKDAANGAAKLVFTLDHVTVTRPGMAEGIRINRDETLSKLLHYTPGSIPVALGHSGDSGSSWSSTVFARSLKLTSALGKGSAGSAYPDGLSGIMYAEDITAAKQAAAKQTKTAAK